MTTFLTRPMLLMALLLPAGAAAVASSVEQRLISVWRYEVKFYYTYTEKPVIRRVYNTVSLIYAGVKEPEFFEAAAQAQRRRPAEPKPANAAWLNPQWLDTLPVITMTGREASFCTRALGWR